MRHKSLAVLGAAAVVLIASCSSPTSTPSTASGAPSGGQTNAAGGYVAIITTVLENPYWDAESLTAQKELEALGYTTDINAHNNDAQRQSELIDAALSKKAVAIVLDPAGAKESVGVVQKATDAGVPVFLINAEIEAEGIAKAQIIANNAQGAELGAQYFAEQMGGQGAYVELYGNPTDNNAPVRSDSYHKVLEQYPDMKLLQTETANWVLSEGTDKMETMLTAHKGQIKGVISGNDEMALGAIAAIEKAGLVPGKDIIVMGFDGSPNAVAAIKEGKLLGTVLQPIVAETTELVKQLDNYLKTGSTGAATEKQAMDCVLIIPDNIDQYGMFSMGE
ncbi:MAG: D-ribose ABC transporter substrate-binding protein [Bifidobacteriaceae bacterium]|jgi:erythritol transport system substrate-binding protein|nr:D-ribose ABC transporter substrate-binding protein [Bifidobacteriaceae bacterium]